MNSRGFTLLELLISVTVLSLIAIILFGALKLGTRSVESGEKRIEFLERSRASIRIVDSQVQSLLPVTMDADEEGTKKYEFTGEQDTMQFPSNASALGGQKGNVLVTYKVIANEDGTKSLHVSETLLAGATEDLPGPDDAMTESEKGQVIKLFDGFDDISFKYYYRDPTEEKGEWIENWTEDDTVPEKIQLHIAKDKMESNIIVPVRAAATLALTQVVPQGASPKPK